MAIQHLKADYAYTKNSLQYKWDFVQHVTTEVGEAFQTEEESLQGKFLLELFHGALKTIPVQEVTRITVKQEGLELLDPTIYSPYNLMTSCIVKLHPLDDLQVS